MSDTSRYRVLHSLGKGGMGEVFLAEDTQLGRKVAIKFLADGATNDQKALDRLYREARSAAALDHPFICKIIEITDIDGRTGIVMEHVSGRTLQAELARTPFSPKRALEISGEIVEALEEAHKKRVVHRDLKPANVMLTEQGHVKVMDFGLAKAMSTESGEETITVEPLTDPGVRVGTPGYMSPEQLLGGDADERSDIFAFGVLLYELLAGVHPFKRSSPSGTMAAILRESHPPVGQYAKQASETARVTLDRLLAKEPDQRYQSFQDVRTDLEQLLEEPSGGIALAAPATTESPPGRTPYVGREAERADARRYLDQAISGCGGVLLLGGEPGVGKTRLAEELLLEARQRGCLALTGRCYELEGTPPFIPWVEIAEQSMRIVPAAAFRDALGDAAAEVAKLVPELRQRFPDIPPPVELPADQQRRFLFSNFLAFVERGARVTPQVLLLDDLHWADESTLLLLQHMAQHVSQMPVLILGTYRDVDLDVDRPFATVLETLARMRVARRLALGRLSEDAIAEMLEALSGQRPPSSLVTAIYAETEGNPFFTEEVFHHLSEEGRLLDEEGRWRRDVRVEDLDVPEGVRLVVGRRIKRLGSEARAVLTTAAVVGRSFTLTLLEALGDAEGEALLTALEEAEAAILVRALPLSREARWEFAHGLIRQTLESSLSLARRQRAHLRVAEAMERVYGDNADRHAADIAQHFLQAGAAADSEKTVRFLTLAGDQALATGAFAEALQAFDEALALLEGDEAPSPADLRYKKGQALRSLGRGDEALEEWQIALALYERSGDADGVARTVFDAAWQNSWLGRQREALALARRGLVAVGDDHAVIRCRLLALMAQWSAVVGDGYAVSSDFLREAEGPAATLDDPTLDVELLETRLRIHYSHYQMAEVLELGPKVATLRERRGELYDLCDILWQPMMAALAQGRFDECVERIQHLAALSERMGHVYGTWSTLFTGTFHSLYATADLTEARNRGARTVRYAETKAGPWVLIFSHVALGISQFYAGDWKGARDEFTKGIGLNIEGFSEQVAPSWALRLRAHEGDPDALNELLQESASLLNMPEETTMGVWESLVNTVDGLMTLGHPDRVAALYPMVLRGSRKATVGFLGGGLWEMCAGTAAGAGKNWDVAIQHFETATRQAHDLQHRMAQCEVRRWYARMLLDRNAGGDHDKARTLLCEASEMYRTIGMPKHLEMVEKMSAEL